ncbi:DUF6892 domain-containing protein [Streptomyces sp. NPDC001732]
MTAETLQFHDRNFKLAVIEELMYTQELLTPAFDLATFAQEHQITSTTDVFGSTEPIPEVLAWFEALEIPADLADAVTSIDQDGGNEVYMAICPQWSGEDDTFDITDFRDVALFPHLTEMTVLAATDEQLAELRNRGIEADLL